MAPSTTSSNPTALDVDGLVAQTENLDIKTTSQPQCSEKPTKAKNLLDMPNEILERIFTAVIATEKLEIVMKVSHVRHGVAAPDELDRLERAHWTSPWVAKLRCTSSAVRDLVSPIIADHTTVQISRMPIEQTPTSPVHPLVLAQLLPRYLSNRIKTISILDISTLVHLQSFGVLDATGLHRLQEINLGPIDVAMSLQCLRRAVEVVEMAGGDAVLKVVNFVQRLEPTMPSELIRMQCMASDRPHVVLSFYIIGCLFPLFDSATEYGSLLGLLNQKFWKISRATVKGLMPSTKLLVLFEDREKGEHIGVMEFPPEGKPTIDLCIEDAEAHKASRYLDPFR